MSHTKNERVILKNDKNGYVIKLTSLKKVKEELKGFSISIKQLKDGEVLKGNLYYTWVPKTTMAEGLFRFVCQCIEDNIDVMPDDWRFAHHPIRTLIKHRN